MDVEGFIWANGDSDCKRPSASMDGVIQVVGMQGVYVYGVGRDPKLFTRTVDVVETGH